MYTFHVILLPVVVVALVIGHVLLVRRHGVVPPYPARTAKPAPPAAPGQSTGETAP
jgi:ubiquinol-cytochrome c reductase cytochrome b subunit